MDKNQIKEKVYQLLEKEKILLDHDIQNGISDNDDLEIYGMDSFAFVKLLVVIEREFNIEIPNEFMIFERWNTLQNILENLFDIIKEST